MQSIFSAPSLLFAEIPIALNLPPSSLLPFLECLGDGLATDDGLPRGPALPGLSLTAAPPAFSSVSTYAVTEKSPLTPALHFSTSFRTSLASRSAIVILSEAQTV